MGEVSVGFQSFGLSSALIFFIADDIELINPIGKMFEEHISKSFCLIEALDHVIQGLGAIDSLRTILIGRSEAIKEIFFVIV